MFPLHESTSLLLAMTAVVACTAVWVALRGQPALWRSALFLTAGVAWPWPLAVLLGLNSYTMVAAFLAGAWTAGALLAGLVWSGLARWGGLARGFPRALPVALVALLPSIVGVAFLLERQRVPGAACAAEVEVHIGDLSLVVPRGIGFQSVAADGAPAQAWEGYYGNEPGGKLHVRALCRATDGGAKPIDVTHTWMSFRSFRRDLEAE